MKRFFSITALLVVAAMLLTACPAAPPQGGGAQPAQSGAAAASGQKVKIRWWHIWPVDTSEAGKHWQKKADEYMKLHPNVEIEITIIANDPYKEKLATNMQAGDPPDLFAENEGVVTLPLKSKRSRKSPGDASQ